MNEIKWAVLFPGQGSQNVGMARELKDNFPWVKELYEEASDAVKTDLLKLSLDGPADELTATQNQQPCILVTSYAWFQVLRRSLDFQPTAGAGHSLGEYSALLAAGAMSLTEAARLVRTRGEMMQSAVPVGTGKMAALIGLDEAQTKELCRRATEGEHSVVVPANFNSPGQVVIAGHAAAVDRADKLASGADPALKARKVISLKVSAPFHCPLMKPVAEAFVPHLQAVHWKARAFPVVANLDAKLRETGDLVPLLRDQIDHPVLWTDCAKTLAGAGLRHFVEMGPGKVLTGLVKRTVDDCTVLGVDSLKDLQAFEKCFTEAR